jgi:lysozyme
MSSNLSFSSAGAAVLKKVEKLCLASYQDSKGVWTIGWGHTKDVAPHSACTEADAIRWFAEDSAWAIAAVNAGLQVEVTQAQFDVLVIFTFNVGASGLKKSDLLKAINAGSSPGQCVPLFFHYINSGGKLVAGLINRRAAEAALFIA